MNHPFRWLACVIALVCVATAVAGLLVEPSRAERWERVEAAVAKGLPKTAIQELEPLLAAALKENDYPEAITALCRKIGLEAQIEGNKPEEKIARLRKAIAESPAEMQPVLHVVLAHWYAEYLLKNGNRTSSRTAAGKTSGNDLTTWDNPRVLAEIEKQFEIALSHEKQLKTIPVARYDAVFPAGNLPDGYRPTLFDVLAFDALDFYLYADAQTQPLPEDDFEFTADSPAFAPLDDFLKWDPKTTDAGSRLLKSIRLYQKLLAFHKNDVEKSARLDADLHRLRFGFADAAGENVPACYRKALDRFARAHAGHELSAAARAAWAESLKEENELLKAHTIALAGARNYPRSAGGEKCQAIVAAIETKTADIFTESVWGEAGAEIRVEYANVDKVYFRIVSEDFNNFATEDDNRSEEALKQLLKRVPVTEFVHQLPPTRDYREHSERFSAPKNLKPGLYTLIASRSPDFSKPHRSMNRLTFWVSKLACVKDAGGGLVVWGKTGEPVRGAKVERMIRKDSQWKAQQTTTTNALGLFSMQIDTGVRPDQIVCITHGNERLSFVAQPDSADATFTGRTEHTEFFTDRSLYRPGQTIQFKGICYAADTAKNEYHTLPNRRVTVQFADRNNKEIARLKLQSNEFGSFSGSFTAPRNRLTGQMVIRVVDGPDGGTGVSVEEYKRPRFAVALSAPKTPARLGGRVRLVGHAATYSGVPIAGAAVRYRVSRQTLFPVWLYMYDWKPAREITHKTAITDPSGNFVVEFLARPDAAIPESQQPTFQFSVVADVTDGTGETRSDSRSVEVGYAALRATVVAADWQTIDNPVRFAIAAKTLDGIPQEAKGTLKIYRLKQPAAAVRTDFGDAWSEQLTRPAEPNEPPPEPVYPGEARVKLPAWPRRWDTGDLVRAFDLKTDSHGKASTAAQLPVGAYRAVFETADRFGKSATARAEVLVLDPAAKTLAITTPALFASPSWTVEPGRVFTLLWGTGFATGRVFIEVAHRGKVIHSAWTDPARTQGLFKFPVTESLRGGFAVRAVFVHDNRAHILNRSVEVPWSNKDLKIKWERFRSKLEPGRKETLTAVITGPDAKAAAAEMVAALYDKSLDAYLEHDWKHTLAWDLFSDHSWLGGRLENQPVFVSVSSDWQEPEEKFQTYRRLRSSLATATPSDPGRNFRLSANGFGLGGMLGGGMMGMGGMGMMGGGGMLGGAGLGFGGGPQFNPYPAIPPNLDNVAARKNLNETAFFFPQLVSDADGVVRMEFTMPEALTKWKFLGFAHDKELRSGYLTDEIVTAKELMAQPNPPRFLRDGDIIEFPVKVSNQSATRQKGKVKLSFKDARTEQPMDAALGIAQPEQEFDIPAGESKTFAWKLTVPDGTGPLTFKTVAASERLSDGEEGVLPVLARKVLVTESIAMPIRGPGTKEFDFVKLSDSAGSTTIRNQSFTVQMVSQPAWYAVMALPYLMEYPHECTEQTFNRLYANGLARHIGNSDPKIRRIFNLWKGTGALDSPLEKNQDLKSVLLDETPWVRQAVKEGQARKNVGILFDENRLNDETARLTRKLADMQLNDGTWPWFPGGPSNRYITLYIATGYGRLRHLGVKIDAAPGIRATQALDAWADEMYRHILRHSKNPDDNHLSSLIALYLYGRSFFLQDRAVANEHRQAVDYWLGQAKKYWLQLANRQSQAHIAVGLKRFGDKQTPAGIMASIKERSVSNEEMGMFWRDLELQQFWFHAPIETQAMMVEAFDEVANDQKSVEDCKVWLLKQKQTQDWKTTKATADAIYALLLRGDNLLKSDALVEMTVGNTKIVPEKVEAGTGFYEQRFLRTEIQPSMSAITLKKTDPGVSWGSATWQYLEDLDKVSRHDAGPLKVEKRLFKKSFTKAGPKIDPFDNTPLAIGDEMVVRVVIRTDRDMEYVHLRDHRGSGTEPVSVLSKYRYQDGLAYYESTKDTATHFFIDYLPKGNYVFEYSVRVQHRGKYPTGYAHIECMYAPEFNSHSENINLEVK